MVTPDTAGRPAVFIDKDGTLIEDIPYNVDPAMVTFTPRALDGLRLLAEHGFALVIVTNQPGVALGYFSRAALNHLQQALLGRIADESGVRLSGFFACPHAPAPTISSSCLCRKPAPGMLRQAAASLKLDLSRSWMIGDILHDIEAGRRAGCRTVLLDRGNETEWRLSPLRTPHHRVADLMEAARIITGTSPTIAEGALLEDSVS